jgi:hypothetical protein
MGRCQTPDAAAGDQDRQIAPVALFHANAPNARGNYLA